MANFDKKDREHLIWINTIPPRKGIGVKFIKRWSLDVFNKKIKKKFKKESFVLLKIFDIIKVFKNKLDLARIIRGY